MAAKVHCSVSALLRALPHVLTLSNLLAGSLACIAVLELRFDLVPYLLLVATIADFLDGFAARAAGVSGPFGRELDSLADVISFGLLPGILAYSMLQHVGYLSFGALLIPMFSALRLARFNIAQSDAKHFIGLATPANTVLWFGLWQVWRLDEGGFRQNLSQPEIVLPLVLLSSLLLVSRLPLFSNKLDPRRRANWPAWIVLAAALIFPFLLGWLTVPLVMLLYILSGLVWKPQSGVQQS